VPIKNTEFSLQKCPVNTFVRLDQQEEKSTEPVRGVEENNKRLRKPTIIPHTTRTETKRKSMKTNKKQ
jgi:hypothetical protein